MVKKYQDADFLWGSINSNGNKITSGNDGKVLYLDITEVCFKCICSCQSHCVIHLRFMYSLYTHVTFKK